MQRLVDHYDLHWRLWLSFERVARHCKQVGAIVMIGWPRTCAYWHEPRINTFLRDMGFVYADFDG
eukprot:11818215-Alexandrium_andersonii.AAC.1